MTTETKREYWLEHEDRFWIYTYSRGFIEVEGAAVGITAAPEMDAFLHKADGEKGYEVSCGVTGCSLSGHCRTKRQAVNEANRIANEKGRDAKAERALNDKWISQTGLSPRYRWDDEEPGE